MAVRFGVQNMPFGHLRDALERMLPSVLSNRGCRCGRGTWSVRALLTDGIAVEDVQHAVFDTTGTNQACEQRRAVAAEAQGFAHHTLHELPYRTKADASLEYKNVATFTRLSPSNLMLVVGTARLT